MSYSTSVNRDTLTPVSFLKRSAQVYPDKVAVVYGQRKYTYRQFLDRVARLAGALEAAGIAAGDKVVFICPNTPPVLEAHFAVPMLGAVLVTVNPQLTSNEYHYIIDHSDARALFVDDESGDRLLPVIDHLGGVRLVVNICENPGSPVLSGPEYESFLNTAAPVALTTGRIDSEDALIAINYTSGTTGRPKGVMYSHRSTYLHSLGEVIESSLSPDCVYLWSLPIFHCNGWCFPWAVTAVGGTQVCLRRNSPREIFRLIEKEGVSHLCASPTVLQMMVCYPESRRVKLRRPLQVITAGSSPSPAVAQGMEEIGANISHVYGLTELHGPHSICAWQSSWVELDPDNVSRMKSRQGVPYTTSVHMSVVDPETMQPVPADGKSIGEVVMRGNNVMLGYYKDEEATGDAFRGGWFHSGDLGVVHPDGYVQIADRADDIIRSGEDLVSSREIEDVIYQHPDVFEVAVVSAPDPVKGEVPKAFVVLKQGANPAAEEIIDFCVRNSAGAKAPNSVVFSNIPKTATGKIIKAELRNRERASGTGRDE
ncbi:AMP-binding protein [Desulforhopalus singaporensis]|uniref:Fatty-acyl-CoA synthase n=1 Tax=Desulforhopalus singaporensis TaxID=91360 RepID=A0A1H0Q4G5_9BACT|nr:AMP-binding protein [Desulforhopalus singaporensis]SDP12273.1 fatty-acyl-CoA synthase [Desulforhopalus singaporensis]